MRRLGALHAVAAVFLLSGACSLDSAKDAASATSHNECADVEDCPAGWCAEGLCKTGGTLSTILIEVTPPLGAGSGANISFLKRLDGLVPSGGNQDIDVGASALITGRVIVDPAIASVCQFKDAEGASVGTGQDGTIPAKVTFMPTARLPGLVAQGFSAQSRLESGNGSATFSMQLPTAVYDILVQPLDQAEGSGCDVTPVLYRARGIDIPEKQLDLNLNVALPSKLAITVTWPTRGWDTAPDKWVADVLHPETGTVLARAATLPKAKKNASGDWESQATLSFSTAEASDLAGKVDLVGKELIRLVPPDDMAGPKLIVARETLSIFGDRALIDHFTRLPSTSVLEGRVTDEGAAPVERALVTLTATALEGVVDSWASYTKLVETDVEGHFTANVLAGSYNLRVVPPPGLGLGAELRTKVDLVAGRVVDVELHPTLPIKGRVSTPLGEPFVGATIQAIPAPVAATVIEQALNRLGVVPVATTGQLEGGVISSFAVEPGKVHISVRPNDGLGYPWLVLPNVESRANVGQLEVPFPVVYQGRMLSGGAPLSGALIRAYAYLDEQGLPTESDMPASVVQIAETRVGDTGQFELLLPPRLDALKQ